MADKVEVRLNGPYRVYGALTLVDAEGKAFKLPQGEWVSLCRCGASATKPFCDGTHSKGTKFNAPTKAV